MTESIESLIIKKKLLDLGLPEHLLNNWPQITNVDSGSHKGQIVIGSYTMVKNSELLQLRENSDKLRKLEAAGVDNWEGYEE